ncbi:hypothetical protein Y032_0047g1529 [Ancylostoma ceylanicum]|uniref:Uncharacterized protein n=1 Tax=Ancylostoma ceylanicum TaxID=53326 RepID=A0A016UB46_9BILA|nr:hypothetical protein Y032_0047g1529 [Ancylostoma ceylanicum]
MWNSVYATHWPIRIFLENSHLRDQILQLLKLTSDIFNFVQSIFQCLSVRAWRTSEHCGGAPEHKALGQNQAVHGVTNTSWNE